MSFARNLVKKINDDNVSILSDELYAAKTTTFIDSGSYILNALLSASIFKGISGNKITSFAGDSGVGKSYVSLSIAGNFIRNNPDGIVIYCDSESAITEQMYKDHGLVGDNIIVLEPNSVEKYRSIVTKLLSSYKETHKSQRPKMMFVLDSLSNLASERELSTSADIDASADMGYRTKMIKATFRIIGLELAKLNIPLICTHHCYDSMNSYIPGKVMSGGTSLRYLSSQIIFLTKKLDKDIKTKLSSGIFLTANLDKSRSTIEKSKAQFYVSYKHGLNKYYGLIDLGVEQGLFKKSTGWVEFPGFAKLREKEIYSNPEKYFTPDILQKLDECAHLQYSYGNHNSVDENLIEDESEE
jgi:RecA/RadA recombinase